jgi:hypothetical protein
MPNMPMTHCERHHLQRLRPGFATCSDHLVAAAGATKAMLFEVVPLPPIAPLPVAEFMNRSLFMPRPTNARWVSPSDSDG